MPSSSSARATRVAEAIRLPQIAGGLPAQTGDCGTFLLVAADPIVN